MDMVGLEILKTKFSDPLFVSLIIFVNISFQIRSCFEYQTELHDCESE